MDQAAQLSPGATARAVLATLALSAACACVSVDWSRDSRQSPPGNGALATLQVGSSTLGDALELLGAPLAAYEHRQTGMALAYGWFRGDSKGLRVSVPVYESASASIDYSDIRQGHWGLLLLFGEDLQLESIREGWLEDLTAGFERQPATVLEEDLPEERPPAWEPPP